MLFFIKWSCRMPAKSHSFSTKTEGDTLFVDALRIQERKEGRANFSWVVIQALKDYAAKIESLQSKLETNNNG